MSQSIIYSAPQGSGKNQKAQALKARFGLGKLVHDWSGEPIAQTDTLALTNLPPSCAITMAGGIKVVAEGWKKG